MVRDDFVMCAGPLMATLGTMTDRTLTDGQGHPIADNQNMKTVGERGPTTLENYHFIEKISHFDRERIPERVVHARGTGAHGYFEASGRIGDEPASTYTRAKLVQREGIPAATVRSTDPREDGFALRAVRRRSRRPGSRRYRDGRIAGGSATGGLNQMTDPSCATTVRSLGFSRRPPTRAGWFVGMRGPAPRAASRG